MTYPINLHIFYSTFYDNRITNEHVFVKKALREHLKIKRLIEDTKDTIKSIHLLEEIFEAHIRFEEKIFLITKSHAHQMPLLPAETWANGQMYSGNTQIQNL